MFAHQVIEDLIHYYPNFPEKEKFISQIIRSQKFHMDQAISPSDLKKNFDHRLFMGDFADGIKLPYEISWFDWIVDGTYYCTDNEKCDMERKVCERKECHIGKIAAFTQQIEDELILVQPFSYFDSAKRWGIHDIAYRVRLNKGVGICSMFRMPTERDLEDFSDYSNLPLTILNSTLMLLSCKNIETEKVSPPEALNKMRRKKGRTELFEYHILVIKPTGKRQKSIPKHLWQNRIHLRRGHFKTYTAENPLFGRITGRFWWQAHIAGRNREGVVLKDYKIKTDVEPSVTRMCST